MANDDSDAVNGRPHDTRDTADTRLERDLARVLAARVDGIHSEITAAGVREIAARRHDRRNRWAAQLAAAAAVVAIAVPVALARDRRTTIEPGSPFPSPSASTGAVTPTRPTTQAPPSRVSAVPTPSIGVPSLTVPPSGTVPAATPRFSTSVGAGGPPTLPGITTPPLGTTGYTAP